MTDIQTLLIDSLCKHKDATIHKKGDDIYACTLNQTDIRANSNKFYIMQLLELKNGYCHYVRYGRIGEAGKTVYKEYSSLEDSIFAFEKQFKTKTSNDWNKKNNFIHKKGKYFLSEISYEDIKDTKIDDKQIIQSTLDTRVQSLIELISDSTMIKNALIELDIDPKKMPLGKISSKQIDDANAILNNIFNFLKSDKQLINLNDTIADLTSDFYTLIPYSCGFKKLPMIDSSDKVSKYIEMLDDLRNLVTSAKILDNNETGKINQLDSVYNSLNTDIVPLDKSSEMYEQLVKYVHNTHASTHSNYTVNIVDIFELGRSEERSIYEEYTKNIGNKYLLFHGSRLANIVGITKLGLLLNPEQVNPNIKITGKMFGYGVYLANSFSKSFNYCFTSKGSPVGCIFLCEAALGKQAKRSHSDYYVSKQSLQQEYKDSIWGQGKTGPDMVNTFTTPDGVKVPNGKLKGTGINGGLRYDELIVYDQRQLTLKYVIMIDADHKY
jgi:poly [ADP-ribose] polymerase